MRRRSCKKTGMSKKKKRKIDCGDGVAEKDCEMSRYDDRIAIDCDCGDGEFDQNHPSRLDVHVRKKNRVVGVADDKKDGGGDDESENASVDDLRCDHERKNRCRVDCGP